MAKRHGRRASRSRRGIKDRLRGIDERENNRVRFAVHNGRATTTREGNVRVRVYACTRIPVRVSPERKPYRTVPYRRQLYSRRKIVSTHARARDATRAHMGAHAARNKGETSTMGLITKSGTISWEFAGNGDLRNSPDCCGSECELRVTMLSNAMRRDSRSHTWDLWRTHVHATDPRINSTFSQNCHVKMPRRKSRASRIYCYMILK